MTLATVKQDYDPAPHGYRRFYCGDCGQPNDVPIHCHSLFCSPCQSARRYRIQYRIQWALAHKANTPQNRWRHVVLTVRNGYNLEERFNHLVKSFRKLRQRKLWKSSQDFGFYVIELSWSPAGWHPHLHIVSYGRYLPLRKLKQAWHQITKDSFQVSLTSIPTGTPITSYITKYLGKPTSVPPQKENYVDATLKARRLFGPFGSAGTVLSTHKPPKLTKPCQKCKGNHWIPEFLMERYKKWAPEYRGASP